MSEQDKTIVQEYCDKLDKRYARLLHVIYGLVVCIIGAGAIQFVSFGANKRDTETLGKQVEFINNNYIPTLFLDGILENQNFKNEELVLKFTGAKKEDIDALGTKYKEFQTFMIDQMIKYRQGVTTTTRGGESLIGSVK